MTNRQKPAPSLQDLVDYVSDKMGVPVSVSSIQKDIYAMRYDESLGFNAPLEYDPVKKGYVYTEDGFSINNIPVSEEDLQGLEMAIGLLEQFKDIPAIKIFEDAITKLAATVKQSRDQGAQGSILILDRPKRYKGIEYMEDIVNAIRGKQALRIQYQPFNKPEAQKHLVHPYFIKEYNGRMYLIGKDIHPTKEPKFLTFSFDRMMSVAVLSQTFREEEVDKENYFRSAIGISLNQSKPEIIRLQFDAAQASYIRSQPLHHSQKILKDTSKIFEIELELVVNYELIALLLSFGDKLKVLKPASLVKQFKDTTTSMAKLYGGAASGA
ncbi:MAG: WYL domain-containing protein [Chitinophagaceae bacterium]|nr:WYL domain-containing protein [Chitinophagaceae bacterium]